MHPRGHGRMVEPKKKMSRLKEFFLPKWMRKGGRACATTVKKIEIQHVCKNSKVYLLQLEDFVVEDSVLSEDSEENTTVEERAVNEEESLEISIHVISWCPNNNVMRLIGRIGACSVEILVDLGSTHNFLDPLMVQAAKLKIHNESSLQVRVANRDTMSSKG